LLAYARTLVLTNISVIAVTPDEAAKSLVEWADGLDMSKSGEYWAPRGPREFTPWPGRDTGTILTR